MLSENQLKFVKGELMKCFSDGIKSKEEIYQNKKKCPIIIHIPSDLD